MNRRRNVSGHSAHPVTIVAIGLAIAIAALGGIWQAWMKNRQIQLKREIDAVERRCGQHNLDIQTTIMRKDQLLNRFAIRQQLADLGSDLVPIPMGVTEEISLTPLPADPPAIAAVP